MATRYGSFEALEKIGEGSLGVVYRCRNIHTGEHAALKTLKEGGTPVPTRGHKGICQGQEYRRIEPRPSVGWPRPLGMHSLWCDGFVGRSTGARTVGRKLHVGSSAVGWRLHLLHWRPARIRLDSHAGCRSSRLPW